MQRGVDHHGNCQHVVREQGVVLKGGVGKALSLLLLSLPVDALEVRITAIQLKGRVGHGRVAKGGVAGREEGREPKELELA